MVMRRLSLIAVVAAVAGLFASSAAVRKAASPTLAQAASRVQLTTTVSAPPFAVEKVGAAIVRRVGSAWRVSLRYSATAPAHASIVVTRDSSQVQSLKFESGPGIVTIGPFVLTEPGQYLFALRATSLEHVARTLRWSLCLQCGELRPPEPPLKKLGAPSVTKGANGWTVRVRFETLHAGAATIRLLQHGTTLTTFSFRPKAGIVIVGPFVIPTAGEYLLVLRLTDSTGQTRTLSWPIVAK
jgi:hypothetical protein